MKEKVYVDRLFADYDDTPEIRDFKEEIAANLRERVKELMSKGLGEEEAFNKAAEELGDITAIADEMGKKRRNEALGQMYVAANVPVKKNAVRGKRMALVFIIVGIGLSIAPFGGSTSYFVATALFAAGAGLYVFFSVTQESASRYAMDLKWALLTGAFWAMGVVGAGMAVFSIIDDGKNMHLLVGIGIALIICAICALVLLYMMKGDRLKPWAKASN